MNSRLASSTCAACLEVPKARSTALFPGDVGECYGQDSDNGYDRKQDNSRADRDQRHQLRNCEYIAVVFEGRIDFNKPNMFLAPFEASVRSNFCVQRPRAAGRDGMKLASFDPTPCPPSRRLPWNSRPHARVGIGPQSDGLLR